MSLPKSLFSKHHFHIYLPLIPYGEVPWEIQKKKYVFQRVDWSVQEWHWINLHWEEKSSPPPSPQALNPLTGIAGGVLPLSFFFQHRDEVPLSELNADRSQFLCNQQACKRDFSVGFRLAVKSGLAWLPASANASHLLLTGINKNLIWGNYEKPLHYAIWFMFWHVPRLGCFSRETTSFSFYLFYFLAMVQ